MHRVMTMVLLVACGGADRDEDTGGDPVCGVDDDGDALPSCTYDDGEGEVVYCDGDSWEASDGCNTCGCDDGAVFCTEIGCG